MGHEAQRLVVAGLRHSRPLASDGYRSRLREPSLQLMYAECNGHCEAAAFTSIRVHYVEEDAPGYRPSQYARSIRSSL
jgi:hypothetical protein